MNRTDLLRSQQARSKNSAIIKEETDKLVAMGLLSKMVDSVKVLDPVDPVVLADLDRLMIDEEGRIKPVAFKEINRFSQNDISAFCVRHGLYQLPTIELIKWLKEEMGDPSHAIEVGAGNGCIGRALGIKMYDNMHQDSDLMQEYYATMNQPTVKYGGDVIKMNGNKAVNCFRPKVVISCWVTQKFLQGDSERKPPTNSSMYGVNELDYIGKLEKYIHVGNENVHHDKRLLRKVWYREYKFPWLVSRSLDRDKNVIYLFKFQR